jgi:hypothetical protein
MKIFCDLTLPRPIRWILAGFLAPFGIFGYRDLAIFW